MDEIFGFFPPTKDPPSKEPMLLLLKQARAYGVGVVLSTQNPVDLDYKGLSNIGTWFIGRLQTSQDIDRVIDGLGGKVGSSFDKSEIRHLLSNLEKRTFFLKSAHLDDIRLFTTRWVMSFLKGPLKKQEISELMQRQKAEEKGDEPSPSETDEKVRQEGYEEFNMLDASIPQYYEVDASGVHRYHPVLGAKIRVGFYNQSRGIDVVNESIVRLELDARDNSANWENAEDTEPDFERFPREMPSGVQLRRVPDFIREDRGLRQTKKSLEEMLYQERKLILYRCKSPKMESRLDESRTDFKVRVQDLLNEKKEIQIDRLKERYEKKGTLLHDRLLRAQARVEKEESDVSSETTATMISAGMAVLGALFGHRSTAKIGSTLNKGSRILKEKGDVERAQQRVAEAEKKIEDLAYELEEKIDTLSDQYDIDQCEIEEFAIKPRRSDIRVEAIALVWAIA